MWKVTNEKYVWLNCYEQKLKQELVKNLISFYSI